VTPRVGVTHDVGLSLSDAPVFSEPARQPPLDAAIASQGRLPRGPAKDQVLRCTRSVFHRRIRPVRGCALFLHNLSPACGVKGERLFNLRAAVTLTRLRTRPRTRLRGFGDGRKGRTRTRSGLKDVAEGTTGIIPGDRGKAGDNWCRHPLPAESADERHISPVPLAGVVSGQSTL
jgi:hypothetical protein